MRPTMLTGFFAHSASFFLGAQLRRHTFGATVWDNVCSRVACVFSPGFQVCGAVLHGGQCHHGQLRGVHRHAGGVGDRSQHPGHEALQCTAYRHLVLAPTQPGHCSRPVLFLDHTHPHGGQPRLEGRFPVRAEQQGQVTVDEGPVQVALTGAPFEEDLLGGAMGLGPRARRDRGR